MKRVYLISITCISLLIMGLVAVKSRYTTPVPVPAAPVKYIPPPGTNIFFDTIAYTDIDILSPARGANTFYTKQSVRIPDPDNEIWSLDNDVRFLWSQLQPDTEAVYNWTAFDDYLKQSIDKRQRVSFGIVTVCTTCPVFDGIVNIDDATASYPVFVHHRMQAETVKDWNFNGKWIPNWNSESYLSSFETFLQALARHIEESSYKGIAFKHVIYKVDIRGFGNWGEWHTYPWLKSGQTAPQTTPTDASLIRIIDAYRTAFPGYPLIANINTFNGEVGTAVGYYALTTSNQFGKLGIRSDHLGDKNTFEFDITNNNRSQKGLSFREEILNRWKFAPVCGEPLNNLQTVTRGGTTAYFHLKDEVKALHISQFSNISSAVKDPEADNIFRSASKASGYRLQLYDGILSNKISAGDTMQLSLTWANAGIAPVYEQWQTVMELRKGTKVIWSGRSAFNPRLFLPGRSTVEDHFLIPASVQPGDYSLYLVIRDPTGYRQPLPLAIQGRGSDGSYLIGTVNIHR